MFINEDAVYSKKDKYPVFIVLTYGDNPLGIAISKITGDEWTHVLIAFNPQLDPMYSFATRTQKSDKHQSLFGFVYQNTKDKWYKNRNIKYEVYVMYVNKAAYMRMQERLEYFKTHERESEYDFPGLISIGLNRNTEHHRKYFCSRFVAEILQQGVHIDKLPSLYRPQDMKDLSNISLVNKGHDMYAYDPKVTIGNMDKIRYKIYNGFTFQEDSNMSLKLETTIFERYLDDKLSHEKYLELTEAMNGETVTSKATLFGCKVVYKPSKIDKKYASREKINTSDVINSAASLINRTPRIIAATRKAMIEQIASDMGLADNEMTGILWTDLLKVQRVEATTSTHGVLFKCQAKPTSKYYKMLKENNKASENEAEKHKLYNIDIKAPLSADDIDNGYLNTFISIHSR